METYKLTEDWAGDLNCGISLRWDYAKRRLDIAMPGYIKKQLSKYNTSTSCDEYNIAHTHRNQKDTAQTLSPLSHKIFRGN